MGEFHKAGTLIVKKVRDLEGIPIKLQNKHFFLAAGLDKLDQYKAREVSRTRNQMSNGKQIFSNTVFEADLYASEVLTKYIVMDVIGGRYDLIGKAVVISKIPLKTYHCDYAYDNWEPGRCQGYNYAIFEDETSNFHLRSDFMNFKEIKERNLMCSCSSQKSQMNRHVISVHEGEKPFKCDICDYTRFLKRKNTYSDIFHVERKPFKCSVKSSMNVALVH